VSEPVTTAPTAAPTEVDEVPPYHEPDFDGQEVKQFGTEDGQAVTVIGKMLVSFFLYSLIVMLLVGYWTFRTFRFEADKVPAEQAAETEPHVGH
jgi:hypothetical protein